MLLLDRLIGLITPHACIGCEAEGSLLCKWCLPDAITPVPERCYRCKKVSVDSATCLACRRLSPLKHVWVASEYEGLVKQLIHRFKFDHAPAARHPIAQLMAESLPYLPPNTLVTHVPTASSRRRERGFDHAELLAKSLSRQLRLRSAPLLSRNGQSRQVGAKRAERIKQLEHAYRPLGTHLLGDNRILLVDDITTTGATLEAAAKTLKDAGAKRIDAVVFAQKV